MLIDFIAGDARAADRTANNLPLRPRNGANHSKLAAFTQLYINFEHEKRCLKKCFMMEGKQKQVMRLNIQSK